MDTYNPRTTTENPTQRNDAADQDRRDQNQNDNSEQWEKGKPQAAMNTNPNTNTGKRTDSSDKERKGDQFETTRKDQSSDSERRKGDMDRQNTDR